MENYSRESRGGLFGAGTRVLAILGLVALVGVGMWGSVTVAGTVPGAFQAIASALASLTSIFVPAGEVITLSAPSLTVASGEAFTLSWEHEKKSVEGSYTFRYDCADGVYFTSPNVTGAATTVFCNVPFNFLNAADSITVTPVSNKNRFIDVTLAIDFTPNGASKATVTGTTVLTVVNDALASSPSTTDGTVTETPTQTPTTQTPGTTTNTPPKTTTPTQGPKTDHTYLVNGSIPQVSNPNGFVDLSVRVIEVGLVDKTTGAFTANATPPRVPVGSRIAVRFAVENKGTKTSPDFDFAAVLPTFPQNIFQSPTQQPLAPGDRIEFTLAFDQFVDADNGVITINADPSGRVNEPNKDNNLLKYTINVVR